MANFIEIQLPNSLTVRDAIAFSSRLAALPESEGYSFNFSQMGNVEPFGLLIASDLIDRFRQARPRARYLANGHEGCSYAAHMGFFRSFGMPFGKAPGQAAGSDTYLPITFINCEEVKENAANEYSEVGDFIDRWSGRIATLLVQSDSGPLFDTVQYSLREVVRNVIEHSESQRFAYCAQYWPSRRRVQIGLVDRGVGLKTTLSANPRLAVASDRDAVQLALMPGVSRKGILPKSKASHDPWANSGFGLYMTSRLSSEGGSFALLSGSAALELNKTVKHVHAGSFAGTALQVELDLSTAGTLSERLAAFREEGIRAARTYFHSESLTASVASTMISRNFQ